MVIISILQIRKLNLKEVKGFLLVNGNTKTWTKLSESKDNARNACTPIVKPVTLTASIMPTYAQKQMFQLTRKPRVLKFQAQDTLRMLDTWHTISLNLSAACMAVDISVDLRYLQSQHSRCWLFWKSPKGPTRKAAWICSEIKMIYVY